MRSPVRYNGGVLKSEMLLLMLFVRVVSLTEILEMECLSKFKAMLENSIGINILSERGHISYGSLVRSINRSVFRKIKTNQATIPNNARSPFLYKIPTYRFFIKRAFLIHTKNNLDNQLMFAKLLMVIVLKFKLLIN